MHYPSNTVFVAYIGYLCSLYVDNILVGAVQGGGHLITASVMTSL